MGFIRIWEFLEKGCDVLQVDTGWQQTKLEHVMADILKGGYRNFWT